MDDGARRPRARRAGFARALHARDGDGARDGEELTAADLRALRELLRSDDAPTIEHRGLVSELHRWEQRRAGAS